MIEDLVRKTQDTSLNLEKGVANLHAQFLSSTGITTHQCPWTDFDAWSTDRLAEEKIYTWLSAPDPWSNYHKGLEQRQVGTGLWFLGSQEYAEWKTKPKSFLWLYGKPGCGKSILATTIIEDVTAYCCLRPETAVVFFYFEITDNQKRKCGDMIRSLIQQFFLSNKDVSQALKSLYSSSAYGKTQPMLESLISMLREMFRNFTEIFIVLDALDECDEREELLKIIKKIAGWETDGLHILVTIRKDHDMERQMELICEEKCKVGVQGKAVNDDICTFVQSKIRNNLKEWQKYPGLQEEIERELIRQADDM